MTAPGKAKGWALPAPALQDGPQHCSPSGVFCRGRPDVLAQLPLFATRCSPVVWPRLWWYPAYLHFCINMAHRPPIDTATGDTLLRHLDSRAPLELARKQSCTSTPGWSGQKRPLADRAVSPLHTTHSPSFFCVLYVLIPRHHFTIFCFTFLDIMWMTFLF